MANSDKKITIGHTLGLASPPGCVWQSLRTMLWSMVVCKAAPWILDFAPDLQTLHNLRLSNRAFYSAYQERPLELIQQALQRSSPAAWELREMGPERLERPSLVLSPALYMTHYRHELYVISRITAILFSPAERNYLSRNSDALGAVTDALIRIWTFCRLFGGGKCREDDWEGQNDWFAGGVQAHEPSGASVSRRIGHSETIALAPECFGKGNSGGLSTEQTIQVLRMWHLLRQTLRKRIAACLDVQSEHDHIERWINQLSFLGLDAVDHVLVSRNPLKDAWRLLETTYNVDRDCLGEACHRWLADLAACGNCPLRPVSGAHRGDSISTVAFP